MTIRQSTEAVGNTRERKDNHLKRCKNDLTRAAMLLWAGERATATIHRSLKKTIHS